jgi:uncharacterized protein
MLKKSQLRFKIQANRLIPFYLTQKKWGELCGSILENIQQNVGKSFKELETTSQEFFQMGDSVAKVAKGLMQLVEKKIDVEENTETDFSSWRNACFEASAKVFRADVFNDYHSYIESLTDIKKNNDSNIYGDLKPNQLIKSMPNWNEEDLLNRYNLALTQGILYHADSIHIILKGTQPQTLRHLLRYFSFIGIYYEQIDSEDMHLKLSGTLEQYAASPKTRLKCSSIAGILPQLGTYSLKANININNHHAKFNLDEKTKLKTHFKPFFEYTPPEINAFYEKMKQSIAAYSLTIKPYHLPVSEMSDWTIPDYCWAYKEKGIELYIFTKYQNNSFQKFLNKFKLPSDTNKIKILYVDSSLVDYTSEVPSEYTLSFKDIPSAQKFLRHLKKYHL